jgi:hypothetical protein
MGRVSILACLHTPPLACAVDGTPSERGAPPQVTGPIFDFRVHASPLMRRKPALSRILNECMRFRGLSESPYS